MGSTSDLPILRKAAEFLDSMEVPFEMNALSAHRTPAEVETFARGAAAGRVSLYRRRECVAKNIPQEEAIDHLINLIKLHGDWKDPK